MALLPLKDYNPLKRIPYQFVTVALMAACVATFFWQLSLGAGDGRSILSLGTIPAVLFGERHLAPELVMVPAPVTLITSMFLHDGWMHLIGNMLFLWVFGDNIEDAMGHARYLGFYLACGIIASLAHAGFNPESVVPMVGASGAISGVLGAYIVLHPRAKVLVLAFWFPVRLPAMVVLGLWIGFQFLNATTAGGAEGGVAWWAHVGGFVAGAVLVVPMRRRAVPLFGRGKAAGAVPLRTAGRRGGVPDSGPPGG